jgi:hypothetical protein
MAASMGRPVPRGHPPSERRRIEIIPAEIARLQRLAAAGEEALPDLATQPG